MVNQSIGNHGQGIFWCGQILPWIPHSRSNKDSQTYRVLITCLLLVVQVWMVNKPVGNHGLGIFWCDLILPWTPSSMSNKDSQT